MPAEKNPQSWWTSLPGVITAVASLLTAVGGLIVVLHTLGAFDRTKSPAAKLVPTKEIASRTPEYDRVATPAAQLVPIEAGSRTPVNDRVATPAAQLPKKKARSRTSANGRLATQQVVQGELREGAGQAAAAQAEVARQKALFRAAQARAARQAWIEDQQTGLLWASSDNGNDIDWKAATRYCHDLHLGTSSGWRLPTRQEILALVDHSSKWYFRIRLPLPIVPAFPLSSGARMRCFWSSTPATYSDGALWDVWDGWVLDDGSFGDHLTKYDVDGCRALCVRHSRGD